MDFHLESPVAAADASFEDLLVAQHSKDPPARADLAPTMGKLEKTRYTHDDMIDFILANPTVSQNQLATRYGYSVGWVSNIMASDAWRARLAARREELVDPGLKLTIEERLRGMTQQALAVIQLKLAAPAVSDATALKALELGAKSLGLGGNAPPSVARPDDHLALIAERLLSLQRKIRPELSHEIIEVQPAG